jgi:hypothetical protein
VWEDLQPQKRIWTGEVHGGQNCEYVAREEFGVCGIEAGRNYSMEWSDIEMETGEVHGGQNCKYVVGKEFGVMGLDGDYMEQNGVALSSNDKRRMMLLKKKKVKGCRVEK